MKAIVCTKYGPPEVLQIKEVEKPTPKDNEVLVKIYAVPVTAMDVRIRGLNIPIGGIAGKIGRIMMRFKFGFSKPRIYILGGYLAGKIETVGKDVNDSKRVTRFMPGRGCDWAHMLSIHACRKTRC